MLWIAAEYGWSVRCSGLQAQRCISTRRRRVIGRALQERVEVNEGGADPHCYRDGSR